MALLEGVRKLKNLDKFHMDRNPSSGSSQESYPLYNFFKLFLKIQDCKNLPKDSNSIESPPVMCTKVGNTCTEIFIHSKIKLLYPHVFSFF